LNSQFKKGVLELLTLLSVRKQDMYGYELVKVVSEAVDVNEGTIYPLLKRMTNEKYFDTYLRESSEGPPRKYYKLTTAGHLRLNGLEREWKDFCRGIDSFISKHERTKHHE
jgi:PadR family transcriptional regulator PadR